MDYDFKNELYVPLERLCLLEATAAVLCEEVLKSDLPITSEERHGLIQIKEDEAHHYVLARQALDGLRTVDSSKLALKLHEYREEHMARWKGPLGMVSRLHEDECLVLRYLHFFEKTIISVIPEEGFAFVEAVKADEPRHHAWGRDVLKRLTGDNEEIRRFVKEQRRAKGWPAAKIIFEFKMIQAKMGFKSYSWHST